MRHPPSSPTSLGGATLSLKALREVGLGYLRLGQPATELGFGEAQRIQIATELQRARRGHAPYLLDEPTSGLHPADVALLMVQLHALVDAGNTVVVEHDLGSIATADWVIDPVPGGGDTGATVIPTGTPTKVAANAASITEASLACRLRAKGWVGENSLCAKRRTPPWSVNPSVEGQYGRNPLTESSDGAACQARRGRVPSFDGTDRPGQTAYASTKLVLPHTREASEPRPASW